MHCGMTPGVVDARAHNSAWQESIQGSAKSKAPCLVNFVPAVAYHICLSLPAALSQPGRSLLADPCILLRAIGQLGTVGQVGFASFFSDLEANYVAPLVYNTHK